ncbi:MAG: transglutaminase domain-containing protein, partial [Acidobacteria bacterium]|nr:transglutaminase domain-containing protein [Acidobacteriota bacterium]
MALPKALPAATLALLSLSPVTASAGTAVAGRAWAELEVPRGVEVEAYRNLGYELRREGERLRVLVDAVPLESTEPFELPKAEEGTDDPVERLARALTAGSRNHYEAVSRILGWVSANVSYELDRQAPQNATAVLDRRTAYCTGFARLSVALLQAAGIRAREVAGMVLQGEPGGKAQFHRWIEVFYPKAGWAFSDPARSHHFVPATYLRLASSRVRVDGAPTRQLLIRQADGLVPVDLYPHGSEAVRARRNTELQKASVLRITAQAGLDLEATLEGGGKTRRLALRRGEGTFLGLSPGTYRLRLAGEGYPSLAGSLRLAAGERRWFQAP